MENQNQQEDLFDVEIDSIAKKHISDIAVWARIVAIATFVSYGISLLVVIFGKKVSEEGFSASTGQAATMAGALIMAIIGVIINIFLFRFATDAKNGVESIDQGRLESGFNNLRIYFKIIGILVIIFISLIVIGVLLTGGLRS